MIDLLFPIILFVTVLTSLWLGKKLSGVRGKNKFSFLLYLVTFCILFIVFFFIVSSIIPFGNEEAQIAFEHSNSNNLVLFLLDFISLPITFFLSSFVSSLIFFRNSSFQRGLFNGIIGSLIWVLFIGFIFLLRFKVLAPYTQVGKSMEPSHMQGDVMLVNMMSKSFDRGDIIIYIPDGKKVPYIKRIIGKPGEVIGLKKGGVYVCETETECNKLEEPYLTIDTITNPMCKKDVFRLTNGYFVMGDNRGHSTDSRCCHGSGCGSDGVFEVTEDEIIGKVVYVVR